jgi:Zn-dependent protease
MQNFNTIQQISIWCLPILFAITLHEAAHGWVALRCGDKTAFLAGRVSLNPLRHIDLLGTIIVPAILISLGGFIFGWAKPVPVNWQQLHNPRRDMAFVALAGPFANLLMALFWAGIAKLGLALSDNPDSIFIAMAYMGQAGILINLLLMVFNLFPIPPLDGSRVLASLLPPIWAIQYNKLEAIGFIILILLLITGVLFPLIAPIIGSLSLLISQLFGLPHNA